MIKKMSYLFGVLFSGIVLLSFTISSEENPWIVPDVDNKKKNPVATSAASIKNGKALYDLHCASCHGRKGLGDGSKAAQLATDSGDFTLDVFQKQTDGSIFYKTVEGRGDMPSYKRKIPDANDVWDMVNYIRTFE